MQETLPLHVVAAIFVQDSKILACRRAGHKAAAGKWEFPGGKVDTGEHPHGALVREIKEELGFDCDAIRTFDISDTTVGKQLIRLETILCRAPLPQRPESTDHDEFKWLNPKELASLDWADPDWPAVLLLDAMENFDKLLG